MSEENSKSSYKILFWILPRKLFLGRKKGSNILFLGWRYIDKCLDIVMIRFFYLF